MAWLEIQGVFKKVAANTMLQPTKLEVNQLEKVAIAGETGAGKSSLLKIIGGMVRPDGGQVLFEGKPVWEPLEKLLPGHKGIAYLSQHFELHNNYLVKEQIEYGNELAANDLAQLVAICQIDHLLERKTNSGLSGGERQRISLAKLLATKPKLLLLDEPFSNLDVLHKNTIKKVIHDIGEKLNITCIMVSHDAADILSWADTILVLQNGAIVQKGTPQQVYNHPNTEYIAGLLGAYNVVDIEMANKLCPAFSNPKTDRKILLRPEHISVYSTDNGLPGIIEQIYFCGHYSLLSINCGQQSLKVIVNESKYSLGNKVWLSAAITAPAYV